MKILWFLLLAVTTRLTFVDANCYDDMSQCLDSLKALVTSENDFWFGDDYHDKCVLNGVPRLTADCITNPDLHKSVLSRFLNSSKLENLTDNLKMAEVIYDTPEGSYYGCDHVQEVPPVDNHRIDPLEMTLLNSWSLDHAPKVTWKPKDDQTMYTVVVWDVGYFYLHGFYINAMNGDMNMGMPLIPYRGPKNPSPTGNVYLFMVIEQTSYIDPGTAGQAIGAIMAVDGARFRITALLGAMPYKWTEPYAVNLMTVVGDTYSAQYQKDNFVINYCPVLSSQNPDVHTVLNEAKIPAVWSYDEKVGNPRRPLHAERSQFLQFTVDLTVEYHSEMLNVDSCCTKTHYMKTLFRVNTFNSEMANPVITRCAPVVQMSPIAMMDWTQRPSGKTYTLMMVDMTDAAYQRPQHNFNIHWLVTDIHKAEVMTGKELLSYAGPLPIDRYEWRVYVFMLFEQEKSLEDVYHPSYVSSGCPSFLQDRCEARIVDMIEDWDLDLAGVTWFMAEQDAYTRHTIYNDLFINPMVNVCDGLEGFEDPCPDMCGGPYPNHATAVIPSVTFALLMAFSVGTHFF